MAEWHRRFLTSEQWAQAEAWRDAGRSFAWIAPRLDVSESYLRQRLRPLPSFRTAPRGLVARPNAPEQQTMSGIATISPGGEVGA